VSQEMVEKLASESKRRIEASAEFAEVYEKLEEYRENAGVIRPADLIEQRKEEREEELEKSPDSQSTSNTGDPNGDAESADRDAGDHRSEEGEEISPQLAEATNVLVDLIAFKSSSQSTAKNRDTGIR